MAYENIHGRKPGRGLRPWLLIPKVIAVGVYLGSQATTAILWFAYPHKPGQTPPAETSHWIEQIGFIFRFITVPALLAATILGVLLFLQHPGAFARTRWLRVKIVSLAIVVPAAHFFLSSRLAMLRLAVQNQSSDRQAYWEFGLGLLAVLATTVGLIILGRVKPRLGQNRATMSPAPQKPTPAAHGSTT